MSGTRLALSPSWSLAAAIVLAHGAAAAAVLTVLGSAMGALLGAALVLLGLAAAWARALLRSSSSVRALEIAAGELTVELRSGEKFTAELAARRHVGRFMVTLPVRRPVRRTVLVTRDMLSAEAFRRLRLWALWGKLPVAAEQLPA